MNLRHHSCLHSIQSLVQIQLIFLLPSVLRQCLFLSLVTTGFQGWLVLNRLSLSLQPPDFLLFLSILQIPVLINFKSKITADWVILHHGKIRMCDTRQSKSGQMSFHSYSFYFCSEKDWHAFIYIARAMKNTQMPASPPAYGGIDISEAAVIPACLHWSRIQCQYLCYVRFGNSIN